MDKNIDINKAIKNLEDSVTYAMSLCSKELFHSNLWEYIMKKDKNFIKVFFPGEDFLNAEIAREHKNHDITIFNDGKIYIIENKIKALPTEEQLCRYKIDLLSEYIKNYTNKNSENKNIIKAIWSCLTLEEKEIFSENNKNLPNYKRDLFDTSTVNENAEQHCVLTGITEKPPEFLNSNSAWTYLSYEEIAAGIYKIIKDTNDEYFKKTLENYCEDIKNIYHIINSLLKEQESCYTFENADLLEGIRFDDVYKKLKMDSFARDIDIFKIAENYENDNFEIKKETDFSNKKANLTIKYENKLNNNSDKKYAIGIQIEEYDFRYFVEMPNITYEIKEMFDIFADIGWFTKDKENLHGKTLASKSTPCNKFAPNFIYQHYKLNEDKKSSDYKTLRDTIYNVFKTDAFKNAVEKLKEYYNKKHNIIR